jgi:hypothetical protein
MFESNFPPDKVSYSYNVLFSAFRPVVWCGVSDLFSGVNAMTGILEERITPLVTLPLNT